jgi:hypothetical protein
MCACLTMSLSSRSSITLALCTSVLAVVRTWVKKMGHRKPGRLKAYYVLFGKTTEHRYKSCLNHPGHSRLFSVIVGQVGNTVTAGWRSPYWEYVSACVVGTVISSPRIVAICCITFLPIVLVIPNLLTVTSYEDRH